MMNQYEIMAEILRVGAVISTESGLYFYIYRSRT